MYEFLDLFSINHTSSIKSSHVIIESCSYYNHSLQDLEVCFDKEDSSKLELFIKNNFKKSDKFIRIFREDPTKFFSFLLGNFECSSYTSAFVKREGGLDNLMILFKKEIKDDVASAETFSGTSKNIESEVSVTDEFLSDIEDKEIGVGLSEDASEKAESKEEPLLTKEEVDALIGSTSDYKDNDYTNYNDDTSEIAEEDVVVNNNTEEPSYEQNSYNNVIVADNNLSNENGSFAGINNETIGKILSILQSNMQAKEDILDDEDLKKAYKCVDSFSARLSKEALLHAIANADTIEKKIRVGRVLECFVEYLDSL